MDEETLYLRAETAMRAFDESVTAEDVEAIEAAAYTGTGEGVGYLKTVGKGLEHGGYSAIADMLEAVWAFDTISREERPSAVAEVRYRFVKKYGYAIAAPMYKQAMYAYAENAPSKEQGDAIKAYLDAGYDPFQLGIDPTQNSVIMDLANAADAKAEAISDWARKSLDQKKGRVFEVSSAAGSTATMQAVATVGSYATGSGLLGGFLGYGLPSAAQEMRVQLASGASRKDAAAMGFMHGVSDTLANYGTSEKFRHRVSGFFGFDTMVNIGAKNAGDVATSRTMLGMVKRFGWTFVSSGGQQLLDETVKDPMLETVSWQAISAATRARLDGASYIQAAVKGLNSIDVVGAAETTAEDFDANLISTLPLAFLAGVGDGFRASRIRATKLAATGTAEDARAFTEALERDLENPQNRDALNQMLHDAAVGQEAVVILMTDEEIGRAVDAGRKAQEQADAHEVSLRNSVDAAEAGRAIAIAAQERMNGGEINPELLTQIANGVEAHAKNSQSAIEHERERAQKQAEADLAFTQSMKSALEIAESIVGSRNAEAQQIAGKLARLDQIQQRIDEIQELYKPILAEDPYAEMPDELGTELDALLAERGGIEAELIPYFPEAEGRNPAPAPSFPKIEPENAPIRDMDTALEIAESIVGSSGEEAQHVASRLFRHEQIQQRIDEISGQYNAVLAENPDADVAPEATAELEALFAEQMEIEDELSPYFPESQEQQDQEIDSDTAREETAQAERYAQQEMAQAEADEMLPVYQTLARTQVYVDDTQRANILSRTGLKTLGQVNWKYGLRLTNDRSKGATSLDGSFFEELRGLAPGRIQQDVTVTEDALMDIVERKKANRDRQVSLLMNRIPERDGGVRRAPYESMDGQVVTPTPTSGRAKKNPVQIYSRLAKSLNIGQAFGTRKMNGLENVAAGYYDTHARYVVSGVQYASNIETDAHEIGHYIGERLGITGTTEMVAKLTERFQAYPESELPGEAFSEFFWRYMLSDEEASRFAGDDYVSDFERRMRSEGILRDVRKAQQETRRYMLAQADERMKLMIRDKSDKDNGDTIAERFAEMERHWVTALIDSTRPAEDVNSAVREAEGGDLPEEMNLRHAALMQSTAPRRAFYLLTKGLTDVDGTIVGDSLKDRLERAGIKGKQFDELVTYMLAKHSLDRDAQDKPVFDRVAIGKESTEDYIRRIEREHPEIEKAERAFQEFRHDFMMEYMVKTGYMTQEMLDTFERLYPHYVPTYRVKDRGKRGVGSQTFEIRRASGSTEQIINPMDSFVDMVNTIVAMNMRNETAKTWDRVYRAYDGMGIFGREVDEDQRATIMSMEDVQRRVREELEGEVDGDIIQGVLDIIGTEQIRMHGTNDVNLPNILTVQMPDGSRRFYEMFDNELFDMLVGTQDSGKSAFGIFAPITQGMSMLTTGSNPLFFVRNAMRDYQNSVNYGSWASNYLTGSAKWLKAAWDVFTENGEYQQYMALGGGGWTRADTKSRKGADEYRGALFDGYNTSNVGRGAKWAGRKIWNVVTANRLNEVVEQASRYVEYRYGKHSRETAEGRREAYLAAQEVTTDFSRKGNSLAAREARMLVPFLNASLQGVYRVGRQVTEAERNRAGTRFMKTVINTGLASALASLWMIRNMDEDEQEEFFWLSDDLKAKHMYIPNFAPDVFGEAPMIRIPLNQDPLSYAVHGAVTNAVWTGEGEEWAIGLGAIAGNILDSINPIGSTILAPVLSMSTNRNWYGSNIVPRSMENAYETNQYAETTPDVFVEASRLLEASAGLTVSPMMLQYIAEQYTGFVGQIAIPMLTKDEHTGRIQGIKAAIQKARSTLTSDPLKSNDVVSCVYDSKEFLETITDAKKRGRPVTMLRNNLTAREARRAENEAYDLTHKGGAIHTAVAIISDGYDRIDEIEANETLTDEQKYQLTSEVRREMIEASLDANEEMQAFREKYVTGETFLTRFMRAPTIE